MHYRWVQYAGSIELMSFNSNECVYNFGTFCLFRVKDRIDRPLEARFGRPGPRRRGTRQSKDVQRNLHHSSREQHICKATVGAFTCRKTSSSLTMRFDVSARPPSVIQRSQRRKSRSPRLRIHTRLPRILFSLTLPLLSEIMTILLWKRRSTLPLGRSPPSCTPFRLSDLLSERSPPFKLQ